jgi:membrane-associated phospholipid phosphatase
MISEIKQPAWNIPAKIISVVFHPLLMPLYGILIIFSAPTLFDFIPFEIKKLLFLIVLINNVFLPFSLMAYLRYRKLITSVVIDNREERVLPLILTTFFYFVTVYIFIKYRIPVFIKMFVLTAAIISLAVMIINLWFMISIHAAGAGALLAMVLVLSFRMQTPLTWFLVPVVLIAGAVLSSRLLLNAHTPGEAWYGFFLGFVATALLLSIF